MRQEFYVRNRSLLYDSMRPHSLLVLFSGEEIRKTSDEFYPFFADRSFLYLTGIQQKQTILLAIKDSSSSVREILYLLPGDLLAERWTGRRLTAAEAEAYSGIRDIRSLEQFAAQFHQLAGSGNYENLYLDLFRQSPDDSDGPSHRFLKRMHREHPYLRIENANAIVRRLRTIKTPEEIEALRYAESITQEGILAMMRASRPGMYEYQYKAEFDHVLGQYGPHGPGFPSIISAGQNNFCIHYYSYSGQAMDGDMILNDVGAQWDSHIVDVSRGWPCNGRFSDRQRLLYECALATSNHLFSLIRPGMAMESVDQTIRQYNAQCLKDVGVLKNPEDIGTFMWHGGSHHIGYDVHDLVQRPEFLAPGMVFCVDVGIYHEAWGIGFRLEDNCLVTETGCENLSVSIPRTIDEIEFCMR